MVQVINDLMKDEDGINKFLNSMKLEDWTKKTDFNKWTSRDIIGRIHYFDIVSLATLDENLNLMIKNMLIDAFNNGKMFITQYFSHPPMDPTHTGRREIIIQ